MSFQAGLSGLNASSQNLSVIGHNIANANTVGMKSGRAEFAEMIASALGVGGGGDTGLGVTVATVSQSFTQGNLTMTGNNLDVAVNGAGFFTAEMPDGTTAYTRDGQFKLDKDGNIVTNVGAKLMGYPTDLDGVVTNRTLQTLSLPTGEPIPAQATTEIVTSFNLDARAVVADSTTPPTPATTYGTTINVYDSQGVEVPVSMYFVKLAPDQWGMFTGDQVAAANTALDTNAAIGVGYSNWLASANASDLDADGNITQADYFAYNTAQNLAAPAAAQAAWEADPVNIAARDAWVADPANAAAVTAADADADGTVSMTEYFTASGATVTPVVLPVALATYSPLATMQFDVNGNLIPFTSPITLTVTSPNPNIGDFNVNLDMSKASQYGTKFAVTNLTQDGYTSGELTGVNIDSTGVIMARYSNGQNQAMGQLGLADFRNAQGLGQVSGGYWVETYDSGRPVPGTPGDGKFGAVQSGAVEASNVDLTAELVNMITAQRSYQANAQTIKTMDQVMQTLVNLR